MNWDRLTDWYNRLPARNLLVAGVAAFAVAASFQAFASSGEYQAGPSAASNADPVAWSAPGRYFLECRPQEAGAKCLNPEGRATAVYADGNYRISYRTINLPAGAYTLKLEYGNAGSLPPNYSFSVKAAVNGQPISAGSGGAVLLPTTGDQPWSADFPVTVPAGESTISIEWTNDSGDTAWSVESVSLISKQATEEAAKRDDKRRQDLNAYREALAQYVVANGKYPVQNSTLGITEATEPFASLKGRFMTTYLTDPDQSQAYYFVGNGSRYGLCADLESEPGSRYEVGPSGSRQAAGDAKDCQLLN